MKLNQNINLYIIFIIAGISASCSASSKEIKESVIPYQEQVAIEVDGAISDWAGLDQTFSVTEFQAPWPQGDSGETVFKAVNDGIWLYFYFQVSDATPVLAAYSEEEDVAKGDRVEFFVSGDSTLKTYYCAELAPNGHILDYQAQYYRKFDYTWTMQGLQTATEEIQGGYRLEGRVPVAFLKGLSEQVSAGSCSFWLGLYRADYFSLEGKPDQINWISWIDPKVKEPDFHIPSSFKKVTLKYNP